MRRSPSAALRALPLALAMACTRTPPVASAPAPRLEATGAGVRWHGAVLSGRATGAQRPVAAWWTAARDTGLTGTAVLVPLADAVVAGGDTVRADSLLSQPRLGRSLWAWDAVKRPRERTSRPPATSSMPPTGARGRRGRRRRGGRCWRR
jgi:hypothetical protein